MTCDEAFAAHLARLQEPVIHSVVQRVMRGTWEAAWNAAIAACVELLEGEMETGEWWADAVRTRLRG